MPVSNPTVVSSGLAINSNLKSGLGGTVARYIGHGTGTTVPAMADVGLQTPTADTRATGTVTRITVNATNDTRQIVGTVTLTVTAAVTECALFDAVAAGNLYARKTFAALNFVPGDTITYTWQDTDLAV